MVFITLTKTSEHQTPVDALEYSDWNIPLVIRVIDSTQFIKISTSDYVRTGYFELYLKDLLDNSAYKCKVYGDPIKFGKLMNTGGVL
jgi:hypothetical protein